MPSALPDGIDWPADGSLPEAVIHAMEQRPLSLYVHVPFCRTRCGYCDFNTYTPAQVPGMSLDSYVAGAVAELDVASRVLGPNRPPVATVFFGGGTPTMLPPAMLGELMSAVVDFGLAERAEVTCEANPETVDPEVFEQLREAGFTRISLGMQSAVPHVLETLDRVHTPRRALDAARWADQVGFEHISLDLIYGTPGESLPDWQQSLDAVMETPVDHVSAYSLIVEPGTRMALQVRRGEIIPQTDDELADKYLLAERALTSAGFVNYETSNWALPGGECRHNLHYWYGDNWWGIGPGAHSHINGARFWNRKHPRSWSDKLHQGASPVHAGELLSAEDRRVERVMLELRLASGLEVDVLTTEEQQRLAGLEQDGLIELRDQRVIPTLRGRLLADGIIGKLLT